MQVFTDKEVTWFAASNGARHSLVTSEPERHAEGEARISSPRPLHLKEVRKTATRGCQRWRGRRPLEDLACRICLMCVLSLAACTCLFCVFLDFGESPDCSGVFKVFVEEVHSGQVGLHQIQGSSRLFRERPSCTSRASLTLHTVTVVL